MNESPALTRRFDWLLTAGLALVLSGPALHVIQTASHQLGNPWPTPILSTLGLVVVIAAAYRRRSGWALTCAIVATLLTAAVWLYVAVALRVPTYEGPMRPGFAIEEFATLRADGRSFDLAELRESPSALVFYRHW